MGKKNKKKWLVLNTDHCLVDSYGRLLYKRIEEPVDDNEPVMSIDAEFGNNAYWTFVNSSIKMQESFLTRRILITPAFPPARFSKEMILDSILTIRGFDAFNPTEEIMKKVKSAVRRISDIDVTMDTSKRSLNADAVYAIMAAQSVMLSKDERGDVDTNLFNVRTEELQDVIDYNNGDIREVLDSPFGRATNVHYVIYRSVSLDCSTKLSNVVVGDHFWMMNPFADISDLDFKDTTSSRVVETNKKNNAKLKEK